MEAAAANSSAVLSSQTSWYCSIVMSLRPCRPRARISPSVRLVVARERTRKREHVVVLEGDLHRPGVEPVPEQDRELVAPTRVGCDPAAPHGGVVDDVVVHERGGVDDLHRGGVADVVVALVAERSCDGQQHGRPESLAAGLEDVGAGLLDGGRRGCQMVLDELLDLVQSGAHLAHHLAQGGQRSGQRAYQPTQR